MVKIRSLVVGAWVTGLGALMMVSGILVSLNIEVLSIPVFAAYFFFFFDGRLEAYLEDLSSNSANTLSLA